jgi:hypothetical protein
MTNHYQISKHHLSVPTTLIVAAGSAKLPLKFLHANTPLNPLPNFTTDPINIPLLTTSMLVSTIVPTLVVVIPALND